MIFRHRDFFMLRLFGGTYAVSHARVHVFFSVVGQCERNLYHCFPARCFIIAIAAATAGASANMVSVGASYLCEYVVKDPRMQVLLNMVVFCLYARTFLCVCSSWRCVVVYCCAYVFSCACGVREHVAGASPAHLCPCMCGQAKLYVAIA